HRLALLAAFLLLGACTSDSAAERPRTAEPALVKPTAPQPPAPPVAPTEAALKIGQPVTGLTLLHNVFRLGDRMISGDAPESPAAFDELKAMGVRTVLSVDGSAPDVKDAEAKGLRYVHIPVTYAEVTPSQQLQIAKVVRELPGPVYVHCHHGMHRGPAAAASAAVLLGMLNPAQGVAFMKQAGTADNYSGLYACVAKATAADAGTLNAAPSDFPSVSRPAGLVDAMVKVDQAFDRLGEVRAAAWGVPADHPDLVPAAEAGQLADNLRFGAQSDEAKQLGEDFARHLAPALERASALEQKLVAGAPKEDLEAAYKALKASCTDCHSVYRNKPR
ncbi:MAG TPA: hypothetical protein VK824_05090, partial [Planctomycetota bacterium]|nr:hypothetical protein [Planctomycetota bacterium]